MGDALGETRGAEYAGAPGRKRWKILDVQPQNALGELFPRLDSCEVLPSAGKNCRLLNELRGTARTRPRCEFVVNGTQDLRFLCAIRVFSPGRA